MGEGDIRIGSAHLFVGLTPTQGPISGGGGQRKKEYDEVIAQPAVLTPYSLNERTN